MSYCLPSAPRSTSIIVRILFISPLPLSLIQQAQHLPSSHAVNSLVQPSSTSRSNPLVASFHRKPHQSKPLVTTSLETRPDILKSKAGMTRNSTKSRQTSFREGSQAYVHLWHRWVGKKHCRETGNGRQYSRNRCPSNSEVGRLFTDFFLFRIYRHCFVLLS